MMMINTAAFALHLIKMCCPLGKCNKHQLHEGSRPTTTTSLAAMRFRCAVLKYIIGGRSCPLLMYMPNVLIEFPEFGVAKPKQISYSNWCFWRTLSKFVNDVMTRSWQILVDII